MRLRLDTHTLLWWLADNPRWGEKARQAIASPDSAIWVSAVSIWEIAIKQALGKLTIDGDLDSLIDENGFARLNINTQHAWAAGSLPPIHRDPFDRMLIAQAGLEGLVLVTGDGRMDQYPVSILWT